MRIDGANNRVGIGVVAPAEILHLKKTATDSNVILKYGNDARDWMLGVHGDDSDKFKLETHDKTDVVVIEASGNATFAGQVKIDTTQRYMTKWESTYGTARDYWWRNDGGTLQLGEGAEGDSQVMACFDTAQKRLGIGLRAPRNSIHTTGIIEVSNVDSNTDAERIRFGRTSDATRYSSIYHKLSDSSAHNFMTFKMHNGSAQVDALKIEGGGDVTVGVGNLVIGTAGKGIDFSAYATSGNPSSNLLDDYEEGTWTVTARNSVTLISGNDLGSYTKIGRMVHCGGQVQVDSDNSDADMIIELPFTSAADLGEGANYYTSTMRLYLVPLGTGVEYVVGYTNPGNNYLEVVGVRDGASVVPIIAESSGYYMFQVTYMAA
jgi:hypothetical protein